MTETNISIRLKINFTMILIMVLIAHALIISIKSLPNLDIADHVSGADRKEAIKLDIRPVKTRAVSHKNIKATEAIFNAGAPKPSGPQGTPGKKPQVSLSDLSVAKNVNVKDVPRPKIQRPGTRPVAFPDKPKAMNAISLKSPEMKNSTSRAFPSGGLNISDMITGAQKISDAVVSIEVPEGIEPDELNEYELMFYGFQKRTATNYMNSIMKNLDKFQKTHPNYRLDSAGRITMTARITYDSEGNVRQIKMVRWTHVNEMQNLFEDIVKDIDQLHNPPKTLWERDGEFAMFYTLEIING
jgi:hypothetical protein